MSAPYADNMQLELYIYSELEDCHTSTYQCSFHNINLPASPSAAQICYIRVVYRAFLTSSYNYGYKMYHQETWKQTRFIIHGSSCLYDPQLQLSAMLIIIFSPIPTRFYYMYNVVCISYFTLFRLQSFQPASITRLCDNTEAFHISFFSDSIPHSMHLNP